jgi:hypothetical protein
MDDRRNRWHTLVTSRLYVEGGGDSKELRIRCREGFSKLLAKAGLEGRMPRLRACGGRESTFDDFKTAHIQNRDADFIAMLIDSEEPVTDAEKTWEHLKKRDNWDKPANASDEQVLFMTTCMETWIAADRAALKSHYGQKLNENTLPPLENIENRSRDEMLKKLSAAAPYAKGRQSFEVLQTLNPGNPQRPPQLRSRHSNPQSPLATLNL